MFRQQLTLATKLFTDPLIINSISILIWISFRTFHLSFSMVSDFRALIVASLAMFGGIIYKHELEFKKNNLSYNNITYSPQIAMVVAVRNEGPAYKL